VRNAHLASAPAKHQQKFSHLLRKCQHTHSVYIARLQIRARFLLPFLVAVYSVVLLLQYNAKLDSLSHNGLLVKQWS